METKETNVDIERWLRRLNAQSEATGICKWKRLFHQKVLHTSLLIMTQIWPKVKSLFQNQSQL